MVERESNKIILYPVSNRSSEVLIPLITRHIETVSTIHCRQLLIGHLTFFTLVQKVKIGHKKFMLL